jgi:hypothetical protein
MKLYPKRLNSLEALRREKIRLRYERRHTTVSDLFPVVEIGRSKITGEAKAGLLSTVIELLRAKGDLQMALALFKPVLRALRKRSEQKKAMQEEMGLPKKDSFIRKLVVEILTGYLTGKALQMAVRSIRMALKRQQKPRQK